jgi:hypothetical protein
MCVLCWQFLTEDHWTEKHFGGDATAGVDREHIRRRDWRHRTQILNHVLRAYGLSLEDWQSRSYVLSNRKGSTVIIQDLGRLWPAAEQLVGRSLDPLDPQLIEALQGTGHAPDSVR